MINLNQKPMVKKVLSLLHPVINYKRYTKNPEQTDLNPLNLSIVINKNKNKNISLSINFLFTFLHK